MKSAIESARDAGLTDGTDQSNAYISGYEAAQRVTISREQFRHAFGQAYCSEENKTKELDARLGIEIERILFET